ncbi:glucose 1-dehydrogenase [Salinibacillus xinjiangensis]|uniref:Glucose 1-dehydrogenase n=1 Tax=Salinibacillus xinjiangensis TaxID=1229268 RepID=A0A6G1X776_9BACI|nr:SDR family oxidoreductase [Salinibacillus xinjiangensis]MRG86797.1 glucose 1-dehydrogenase [Salinibacillus xinjiangensis]
MSILDQLFQLDGKVALVTGGGRGLGKQIALTFAEAGAKVMVCSRKVDACEETVKEIENLGGEGLAIACDVSDPEQVQKAVDQTLEHFGQIDILVNNSGASWGAPVLEMPIEAWYKVMNVNATGTFLMSQAVGKHMVDRKSGKIINISSVAGLNGVDPRVLDAVGYNASKGAIATMTKDLAAKWGPYNINVNAIAPGFFPTKMTKGVLAMAGEAIVERTPLGRLGSDDDIKGVALFLASKASDYVTGDIISVDGGMNAM